MFHSLNLECNSLCLKVGAEYIGKSPVVVSFIVVPVTHKGVNAKTFELRKLKVCSIFIYFKNNKHRNILTQLSMSNYSY